MNKNDYIGYWLKEMPTAKPKEKDLFSMVKMFFFFFFSTLLSALLFTLLGR